VGIEESHFWRIDTGAWEGSGQGCQRYLFQSVVDLVAFNKQSKESATLYLLEEFRRVFEELTWLASKEAM